MNMMAYFQQRPLPSLGLLAFRAAMGSAFILHGLPKIHNAFHWMGNAPVPGILQALSASSEFFGGIALILGFLTPLATLGLIANMMGALMLVHLPKGDPFVAMPGHSSFEPALIYLMGAIMILLNSPGKFSIDYLLAKMLTAQWMPHMHLQA